MSGFHFRNFSDYEEAVADEIQLIGEMTNSDAQSSIEASKDDVRYGFALRLSPAIIAAKILGINHCCAGVN